MEHEGAYLIILNYVIDILESDFNFNDIKIHGNFIILEKINIVVNTTKIIICGMKNGNGVRPLSLSSKIEFININDPKFKSKLIRYLGELLTSSI